MWGGRLRRCCETLPACRQDAIRIGLLLPDIATVDPLLRTAADPGDHLELVQALEGIGDSSFANIGLAGDRRVGGIKPPGFVVEEIKQEDMENLQAAGADGAAMHAWLMGLPVKFPGAVPEQNRLFPGQRGELDRFCAALTPHRKRSIRNLRLTRQTRQDPLGECRHELSCPRFCRGALEASDRSQFPASKWDLLFCRRYTRLGLPAPICISPTTSSCGAPHRAPLACLGFSDAVTPWQLPQVVQQHAHLFPFFPPWLGGCFCSGCPC